MTVGELREMLDGLDDSKEVVFEEVDYLDIGDVSMDIGSRVWIEYGGYWDGK
jgi:hypothetical protein